MKSAIEQQAEAIKARAPTKLNDAMVLDQMEGKWQKMLTLIIWKLRGKDQVIRITVDDMLRFEKQFAPGMGTLFTRGTLDSFEFSVVDTATAEKIAAHAKNQSGGKQ